MLARTSPKRISTAREVHDHRPRHLPLSYNREDQARAKLFAEAFEGECFKVWRDVGLRTGEAYDQVTERALKAAKAVLVLWSGKSVESRWVRAEATLAVNGARKTGHVAFEKCTRRRPKNMPHRVIVGAWKGPPGALSMRSGDLGGVRR